MSRITYTEGGREKSLDAFTSFSVDEAGEIVRNSKGDKSQNFVGELSSFNREVGQTNHTVVKAFTSTTVTLNLTSLIGATKDSVLQFKSDQDVFFAWADNTSDANSRADAAEVDGNAQSKDIHFKGVESRRPAVGFADGDSIWIGLKSNGTDGTIRITNRSA